jgi:hypothetical protein
MSVPGAIATGCGAINIPLRGREGLYATWANSDEMNVEGLCQNRERPVAVLTPIAPLQGAESSSNAIQGWRPDKSGLTPG